MRTETIISNIWHTPAYLMHTAKVNGSTFKINGREYAYYDNWNTWQSERRIEIPYFMAVIRDTNSNILEVGNVIQQYFSFRHDIIDRDERRKGVQNIDILNYEPKRNYDLVFSISTLEHVSDTLRAIGILRKAVKQGGELVYSLPIDENPKVDELLIENQIQGDLIFLKRISKANEWVQVDKKEALECRYNKPYRFANAIVIVNEHL